MKRLKKEYKFSLILLTGLLLITACSIPPSDTKEKAFDTPPSAEVAEAVALPTPALEIVPAPILTQIKMLDAQNGWGQADGMVLRTEDGGTTWLDVTPADSFNNPAYSKSFFLDAKIGWVLLEDLDSPTVGTIFRTTDGGISWRWRNTPFGRSDFGFLDAETGYALTGLGAGAGSMGVAIWETKNGGGDWDRTFLHEPGFEFTLPFNGIKNGISYRDPLSGWVTGSIPKDGVIWFYRTRDGGFSWEEQPLDMPLGYESAQTSTNAPRVFDGGVILLPIYLLGEESAMVFYRSTDNGETWTATLPVPTYGKYAIASSNEIIAWDGGTTLYASQDGGETWSFHATNWQPNDLLRALDFVSATEGWALSEDGLYRTIDGGKTWESLGE
ncbi:MAG: hypothetical protein HN855_08845 [Anaerolineae bacterium]|jgi:hypothetical protein|nr:hypothetical protein [Anaerolineae bacterium]MBT7070680.1 hypothetical protein [Anaerolineae bacterium]MBT7325252.1 hypothetical protein [Anaerolineae bacterium]